MNFMFPEYVDMADGGAASKVSRIIEKCRDGGVEGIPDDLTSHGIRVSAADEMMFNEHLPFFAAIARGGWDCKADTLLFFYLTLKKHVATAGKALAGWADPNMTVTAPTLEAIYDDSNRDAIDNFCHRLFQGTSISALLSDSGKLKGFRSRMVASLLMYHASVKKTLDRDSDIVRKVALTWIECGLEMEDIERYGDKIKERFQIDNAMSLAAGSGTKEEQFTKAIAAVQEIAIKNSNRLVNLENKVERMSEDLSETKAMVEKIYLAVLPQQGSPSSGQKRKKPDEPSARTSAVKPSASVAAVRPLGQVLLQGQQQEKLSEDWNNLGHWDSAKLLTQCLKAKEDFTGDRFLLHPKLAKGSTASTKRSRAKAVLSELKIVALRENENNQMYFHHRFRPRSDDTKEWNEYFDDVGYLAQSWANTVKNNWYIRYKAAKGIPDGGPEYNKYIIKKNGQMMNVSALGSFLEDVRKLENNRNI